MAKQMFSDREDAESMKEGIGARGMCGCSTVTRRSFTTDKPLSGIKFIVLIFVMYKNENKKIISLMQNTFLGLGLTVDVLSLKLLYEYC